LFTAIAHSLSPFSINVLQGRLKSWRLADASTKVGGIADGTTSGLGSITGPAITTVDGDKALYLDALPFASAFLTDDLDLAKMRQKVQLFVDAAKETGFPDLQVFLRGSSSEVDALWRRRKEKEVKEGTSEIPGLSILIGEAFEDAGAGCQYSTEGVDFLETIASHADHDSADILSVSRDLLFFKGKRYSLFKNFEVRGGERLVLEVSEESGGTAGAAAPKGGSAVKAPKQSSAATSFDLVTPPPPTVDSELNIDSTVTLGVFLRAAPSPLVRDLGFNPYAVVRDLRRSLYAFVMYGQSDGLSAGSAGSGSAGRSSEGAGSGHASPVLFSSSVASSGIREEILYWDAEKACASWEVTEGVKPLDERNPNDASMNSRSRASSVTTGGSGGRSPMVFQRRDAAALRALLLGDPFVAFREFFPEEAETQEHAVKIGSKTPQRPSDKMALKQSDWSKHVFACGEVIAEMHAIATGKRLIDVMIGMGF
jgi:hypothetical protein